MQLKFEKTKELLSPVLLDSGSKDGPDPSYWVFTSAPHEKWENVLFIPPGCYGKEFNKTYGHYHSENEPDETYKVISGKGVFVLQEKYFEKEVFDPTRVKSVLIVAVNPGEEITISNKWGHSWSNLGDTTLVTMDDWRIKLSPTRYDEITKQKGMAYYLVKDGDSFKPVPNPNYKELPKPRFLTLEEYRRLS